MSVWDDDKVWKAPPDAKLHDIVSQPEKRLTCWCEDYDWSWIDEHKQPIKCHSCGTERYPGGWRR
jgi:hypothetical protein